MVFERELEKQIAKLKRENSELKADNDARKYAMAMSEKVEKQLRERIEKMKCCGNCKHLKHIGDCICGYYTCDKDGENEGMFYPKCNNKDKWELED